MDERNLLEQLSRGSEDAYKELFHLYYSPLCEYASFYLSDEDSEDLVQEIMIILWEQREILAHVNSLKSYLFIVVRNRCLNVIEKEISRQRKHSRWYEEFREKFENPDFYLANDLMERIQEAIAELPESYREVFDRSRFTSKTNRKIAGELGISVKTVEYRITQSLKILRKRLSDYLTAIILFG
ncbi:MAG: RNA polymerase sigma-70 factor [Candidatus Azobacteroides sp.]|nr:RNA polymerase sigma-70 factor [Candidatus Azobacteroides sp.]